MKKTLPEKFIKEPTGFPFSPVLSIEGKEIVVTSGTCCDDYDGQFPVGLFGLLIIKTFVFSVIRLSSLSTFI